MKKLLALLLVIVSIFSLASCSLFAAKPKLNLDDAKDNLEDNDYSVTYVDKDAGTGVKEYLRAYNDKGDEITIYIYEDATSASIAYKMAKLNQDQQEEYNKLRLKRYQNLLKKYEDDMSSSEIDSVEDSIKDLKKSMKDNDYVIGKSGKTVWYGTKDAIKDTKK